MKRMTGYPLPLGISVRDDVINFSVAVESGKTCFLCLYHENSGAPLERIELTEEHAMGEVRYVALSQSDVDHMEYNYEINGELIIDPYVKSVAEHENITRGKVLLDDYDWEEDKPLGLPLHEIVAYNLHVRGFTMHKSSKVKNKGTFAGVIEKIPYLKDLGINQIQCMPIYAFEETSHYKNYWGYGDAYCFAIKNAYAADADAEVELKDMVKACHKNGIEVVLYLPFTDKVSKQLIEECLRYYVMEYHIDGFVLNPYNAPMSSILSDPILKKTKILEYKDDFQNNMRSFLIGNEGTVQGVMWWVKQITKDIGCCNYITNHTGFTLNDLVSYNEKHNEANGENNFDGPDANFSWNCGVEGPTRKKAITELRRKQMRNAMFLLIMSQGTPCILAGDEFANTQNGNNNVYCQDNETSWLDWKKLEKEEQFYQYVKRLIALRRKYSVIGIDKPLLGVDKTSCGVPDVSFHGENAWQIPNQMSSKHLGVYYHHADGTDCFIAYNMHDKELSFALPGLRKGKKWYRILSTADAQTVESEILMDNQKETVVPERTIEMFIGK